jgi:aryl-alcohol dehydrogenase-like predicted oxidoreductase
MKLALGTVQFGLDYGVTNKSGKVSNQEINKILSLAKKHGLNILDTAAAYGNSEEILGKSASGCFKIISKIPSLSNYDGTITESVYSTLSNVKRSSIYGMILHDERDIRNKAQYRELMKVKDKGIISKIGCSFYSLDALEFSLNNKVEMDIIQIPGSCLDQRFEKSGLLERAKERNIEVHCRSLFLQGILLEREALPSSLKMFEKDIASFYDYAKLQGLSPIELALSYVFQCELIDYGVVGCQSKSQLDEIICSYNSLIKKQLNIPLSQLASSEDVLLNPAKWS